MQPEPLYALPVPHGPRAYRRQLRQLGPMAGLLPPTVLGLLALAALHNNTSSIRGGLGFLLAVLAVPCLLAAGAPLTTGTGMYLVAIAGSAVIWFAMGVTASRRATRAPVATWRDFWREYLWLVGGVWLGVALSLLAVDLVLGRVIL
jgi:hypothetical protein